MRVVTNLLLTNMILVSFSLAEARKFPILQALFNCEQGVSQAMAEKFSIDTITQMREVSNEVEPGSGFRNTVMRTEYEIERQEDIQIAPSYSTEYSVLSSSHQGKPGLMIYTGSDNAFVEIPAPINEPTNRIKICRTIPGVSFSGQLLHLSLRCGEIRRILDEHSGVIPRYIVVQIPNVGKRAFLVTTTMMGSTQAPSGIVPISVEQAESEAAVLGIEVQREIHNSLLTDDRLNAIAGGIRSKVSRIHTLRSALNYRTQGTGWDERVMTELRSCQTALGSIDHPAAQSLLRAVEGQMRLMEALDARPITEPVRRPVDI